MIITLINIKYSIDGEELELMDKLQCLDDTTSIRVSINLAVNYRQKHQKDILKLKLTLINKKRKLLKKKKNKKNQRKKT